MAKTKQNHPQTLYWSMEMPGILPGDGKVVARKVIFGSSKSEHQPPFFEAMASPMLPPLPPTVTYPINPGEPEESCAVWDGEKWLLLWWFPNSEWELESPLDWLGLPPPDEGMLWYVRIECVTERKTGELPKIKGWKVVSFRKKT
ncbi:MAG: hypothetical protein K6T80_08605 [Firmicutes bacterium]|nr:hypothetical protein [Bacillota bacterium]